MVGIVHICHIRVFLALRASIVTNKDIGSMNAHLVCCLFVCLFVGGFSVVLSCVFDLNLTVWEIFIIFSCLRVMVFPCYGVPCYGVSLL